MKNVAIAIVICFIGVAIGCSMWLGFFKDAHYFNRDLSQEKRGAEWVGQNPEVPPSKPIEFEIHNHGCLRVDRALVDGDTLTFELTRVCGSADDYAEMHWRAKAGNTVIASGSENWQVDGVGLGEQKIFEINNSYEFKADPRITSIVVSTKGLD